MAWSKIEWTEASWNPLTGCTKISAGCKYCYAERMALRLQAMGNPNYVNGFSLTCHEHILRIPYSWKAPRLVFVNSMSDMFHEDVPTAFILQVFDVMRHTSQHTYQVLTKRTERLVELAHTLRWPKNVWMGVSIEDSQVLSRIDHLRNIPAAVRFLSCEPLLASLGQIDFSGIHWVIVGGESGPRSRPMNVTWVQEIRDQCATSGTPFFFKQWGGINKKKAGRSLDGKHWDAMPRCYPFAETKIHHKSHSITFTH